MNFIKYDGKMVSTRLMVKIQEYKRISKDRFCMYCISKNKRHYKDCPTRKPDFNPQNEKQVDANGKILDFVI